MLKKFHIIVSKVGFLLSRLVFCLPLSLSLVLTACNTAPTASNEKASITMQAAAEDSAIDKTAKDRMLTAGTDTSQNVEVKAEKKGVSLDGDMLFNLMAAEFAGNSGDIDASLTYYRKASKSIEDSRIAARTAYIAQYGEYYDETLTALDRWRELDPDAQDIPRMFAVTYLRMGQPEKAVPHIEDMLLIYHETPVNEAVAVKQLLAKESNTKDAYAVLQKLNEKNKKNEHLLVLQSRYAAQLKKYGEALALLDQVLEINASLHEVLIIKARILTAQGQHEKATLLVKQVLGELPENNTLRLQYARMLVEQRKMEAATEQYFILHENLPKDSEVTLSLALLYIETKRLDDAVEALKYLVGMDKKVSIANYYLARITQNQGHEKKAISYYLGVKNGEYVYDAQLRISVLLAVLGKVDEALSKLEVLAEEQKNWSLRVKSYLAQGEILRNEHRYKEGVEMYSRALQQKRDDTTLLYARGLMAEKVDRLDMAEADLLKVISKEPDNADALNALGYTLADRTSRYKEAQEYIKRAAALVPDDPAILDSLGWVSYRLGEMDEALKWLSKAFAKLEDAEIAAHYGEVLWHTNQKDKAREVWNKGKGKDAKNKILMETLERLKP